MEQVVFLTKREALELSKLCETSQKALTIIMRAKGGNRINPFNVKWQMDDGRTLAVKYKTDNKFIITAHCECEIPALLMNVGAPFIPFDIKINISNEKHLQFTVLTKHPIVQSFLDSMDSNGRMNRDMLFTLYRATFVLLNALKDLTTKRIVNNVEEIRPMKDITRTSMKYIMDRLFVIRNEQMFNGWDTVTLTYKQLKKLEDIFQQKGIHLDFFHQAMERFCFINVVDDKRHCYFYELKSGVLHCEYATMTASKTVKFEVTFTSKVAEDGDIGVEMEMTASDNDDLIKLQQRMDDIDKACWEWIAGMFFVINTFMLNYSDVSMDVEEKIATAPLGKKQSKKQNRNTQRLFKSYTLKRNWVSAVSRKHHEITCPAWSVRGHFRHLRNGKVIFIEPFIKGREKDNFKGKEYALLPYKDA